MFFFFLTNLIFAGAPVVDTAVDAEIIVTAHRDFEVYVVPIQYHIYDDSVEAVIPHNMVFNYTASHSRNSKVKSERGLYEPITMHGGMKVYNADTIKYAWDNCNYSYNYKKCAHENNHYFIETHVTVDSNELTISITLFDSKMQVISTSQRSDTKSIKWIKQQEVKSTVTVVPDSATTLPTCIGGNCNDIITQNDPTIITNIQEPKEEMPLKWEIPHRLLSSMVYQTSIGAWAGVRIN